MTSFIEYRSSLIENADKFKFTSEYGQDNLNIKINKKIDASPTIEHVLDKSLKLSPDVKWKSTKLNNDIKILFSKNQFYTFAIIQGRKTHSEGTRLDREQWELKIIDSNGDRVLVPSYIAFSKSSSDLKYNAVRYIRNELS